MASFVEGARVRADALARLADAAGGASLGAEVRALLVEHPLPLGDEGAPRRRRCGPRTRRRSARGWRSRAVSTMSGLVSVADAAAPNP